MDCSSVLLVSKWPCSDQDALCSSFRQDEIHTNFWNTLLGLEMLIRCKWESGYNGEEMSFESLMDSMMMMMMDGNGAFY